MKRQVLSDPDPKAAFNPGTMYLLSRWYTRRVSDPLSSQIASTDLEVGIGYQELAFRSALLYSGFLLSNAFGSVSVTTAAQR